MVAHQHPNAAPDLLPILPVRDLDAAADWWSRLPDLTVDRYGGGGYAFVRFDGAEVAHLAEFTDLDPAQNRAGCYVHVPDVDTLREQCLEAGLSPSAVRREPWGMSEFRLTDPSGNLLRLGCAESPETGQSLQ